MSVAIAEAIRTRCILEIEHRVIRAGGTLGWTYSGAVPVLGADGNVVEWVDVARDGTPHR